MGPEEPPRPLHHSDYLRGGTEETERSWKEKNQVLILRDLYWGQGRTVLFVAR